MWKRWLIEKLGGYPDLESALAGRHVTEKYEILNRTVRRLYNTVGAEDILRVTDSGEWIFQGKALSKQQQQVIVAEAVQFTGTTLWKVLETDVKYQANRAMFTKAASIEDLVAGKLWIWTIDAFRTRLSSLAKGSPLFNNKK